MSEKKEKITFNSADIVVTKRGGLPGTFEVENYFRLLEPEVRIGDMVIRIFPEADLYELSPDAKLDVPVEGNEGPGVHKIPGPELIQLQFVRNNTLTAV